MAQTIFRHIFFVYFLPSILLFSEVKAAGAATAEDMKKVDSLNEFAFKQKRFDAAHALNNLFFAQNIANSTGYKKGLATAYLYEAGIYNQNGYYNRALSQYFKSLALFKTLNDTFYIAFTSQQIALALQADGKIEEAIGLYNKALDVYVSLNKQKDIANIKNSLGKLELDRQQLDKADKYFTEAFAISIKERYIYGQKKAYYYMGLVAAKKKNFKEAEILFKISLTNDEVLNDNYGTALNQIGLSSIYATQLMPDSSISMAKNAYKNASVISAFDLMQISAIKVAEGFTFIGDAKMASQWKDSLIQLLKKQSENERVYALNFIDVIKSQDVLKMDAEKEVIRAKKVQQEQLLIITVGTFILIIVAILAVLALVNYQRQRFFGMELKQKNEIIEKNSASLDLLNKEISHQNALLETDNNTKSKLLSIISHDLRTPLVNTKGILNLVNQGMVPKHEAEQLLQQLETQYIGTTSLLDNLLFWIKGKMQGKEENKIKVGLYQLMKSLEDEQYLPLMQKKLHFKNNVDPGLFIMAEREMIRIVCRNLISNAIKFTKENGDIELTSRKAADGSVYITVKDSGIGISKETIEKVNEKQYFNTAGTAYEKGSGFGLMLCADLIAKFGGELIIESEPGNGSSFTVKIPDEAN